MLTTLLLVPCLLVGDLNPPPGPVTATGKTTNQIEPRIPISATTTPGDADSVFRITASGSYYLTDSVTGVAGKKGIEIAAGQVEIDLAGYMLLGAVGATDGIGVTLLGAHVTIRNGVVMNWPSTGLDLSGTNLAQVEDVTARSNGGHGLIASGDCRVVDSTFLESGQEGMHLLGSSRISGCTVISSGSDGIHINGNGSLVEDCVVNDNSGDGIHVSGDSVVRDNLADSNQGHAIWAGSSDNRIERNNVTDSQTGIFVFIGGNLIIGNSASDNTTNYSIVAGNFAGTIATTEAAMNAATNGLVNISF